MKPWLVMVLALSIVFAGCSELTAEQAATATRSAERTATVQISRERNLAGIATRRANPHTPTPSSGRRVMSREEQALKMAADFEASREATADALYLMGIQRELEYEAREEAKRRALDEDRFNQNFGDPDPPTDYSDDRNLDENFVGLMPVTVQRVIDGDTIEVEYQGQPRSLRLIGVDTPESVHPTQAEGCFGREATAFTTQMIDRAGWVVFLEKDVSETDLYGRLLRYVWLAHPDGNRMLNQELVSQGYALVMTYPPDVKYVELFRDEVRVAQANHLGFWGACFSDDFWE